MIEIEFTSDEIDALEHDRYHYPDPKVQKKLEAVYLKSQGLAHSDICRICRVCKTTLTTYLHQYAEGGLDRLKASHYVRKCGLG
jgi:hypothetical protein